MYLFCSSKWPSKTSEVTLTKTVAWVVRVNEALVLPFWKRRHRRYRTRLLFCMKMKCLVKNHQHSYDVIFVRYYFPSDLFRKRHHLKSSQIWIFQPRSRMRTSVWTLIRYSSGRRTWTQELVKLLRLVRTPWKPRIRALCSMFIPCKSLSFPINCCCVWILKGQESIPVGAYCPLSNRACFGGRGRGGQVSGGVPIQLPWYLPLGYLPSPHVFPLRIPTSLPERT